MGNQYDINDFKKMCEIVHNYDCIITFRYKKIYSSLRILISWIYNKLIQFLFKSNFRDISTGLRLIKESLKDITLTSQNAFIGAEIAIKLMLKGYQVEKWVFQLTQENLEQVQLLLSKIY